MGKAHRNGTADFGELNYRQQAHAINAEIANLPAAMRHHVGQTPRGGRTKQKCIDQMQRLLNHVNAIP